MKYILSSKKEDECIFCLAQDCADSPESLVVYCGQRAFVILNRFPYTSGHVMIVPYEHQPSLENLEAATRAELMELTAQSIQVIQSVYQPQGFNIGVNIGEAAGAGIIGHVHMHVVPRWVGDTNFMSSLGMTRVLPETLETTCLRLRQGWVNLHTEHTNT